MTDQALDNLARRVILDAARLEYGSLIEELPEHDFSPEFEKKMKKLLRQGRHPVRYRTLRAAACLLLVLFLSGCAVLAISPGAREAFIGWVREIHDTYFLYKFWGDEVGESLSKADTLYYPAYVPSGYRIEQRTTLSDGLVSAIYINDQTGRLASFAYFPDTSSSVLQITWENDVIYKKVLVNEISADLYLDSEEGGSNVIVWVDKKNGAAFKISGAFGEEELIRMAKSVHLLPRNVIFRPSWLPKGYYEVSAEDWPTEKDFLPNDPDSGQSVLTYEDGKGGQLTVTYTQQYDLTKLRLDRREVDVVSVLVDEDQAFLFPNQTEDQHLAWVDRDTGILFWISAPLTSEELIKVAESVEAVNLVYSLGWVPEGYEWFDSHCDIPEIIKYRNQDGDMLLLSINKGNESIRLQVQPTEGDLYKQISVSGVPADLYLNTIGGNSILIWMDEEDGLVFVLNGPLTEEELIQVAEHVKKSAIRTAPHRPGWIPEGYVCHGYGSGGASFEIRYDRDGSESIWFRYGENSELQEELHEELKDLTPESIQMNGQPALLYTDVDSNQHLIWSGTKLGSDYWLSGPLDIEELIQIAMSVGKTQE